MTAAHWLLAATLVATTPNSSAIPPLGTDVPAKQAAGAFLRHLYAVHLSIRGCTEAARLHSKPEYLPSISLEESRRLMRLVDDAAKEVGIDADEIWSEVGPVGAITAEAIKADTPGNVANCARIGGVLRIDLGNLQNALRALGSQRALIEKDF